MLDAVIRLALINNELLTTVRQGEHAQVIAEPFLIQPVLAFHLAVVPWHSNLDPMTDDAIR